jgi:hypothetical protein
VQNANAPSLVGWDGFETSIVLVSTVLILTSNLALNRLGHHDPVCWEMGRD